MLLQVYTNQPREVKESKPYLSRILKAGKVSAFSKDELLGLPMPKAYAGPGGLKTILKMDVARLQ